MVKCGAVIVAAGRGTRMGSGEKKQFLKLNGIEIISRTISKFENAEAVGRIAAVVSENDLERCEALSKKHGWKKTVFCPGGKERQNSVYNGLLALGSDTEIVLIHDGVRPFVSEREIDAVISKAEETGACVLAVPVKDTIKVCSRDSVIVNTPERSSLWAMQTPQGFCFKALKAAYEALGDISVTDDAAAMELAGHSVSVVMGSYRNIKITTPEDLLFAEALLKEENNEKS